MATANFEGMATTEKYYFGQGKVFIREKGSKDPWRWIGDVSTLVLGTEGDETIEHKESYSGRKQKVRVIRFAGGMTLNATMHQIDNNNLAMATRGTIQNIEAGTITGEEIGAIKIGDVFMLENGYNVSEVKLMDGATEIPEKYYDLDAMAGTIEILGLPDPTTPPQAVKVNYKHTAASGVVLFNTSIKDLEMIYKGINMAEAGMPVTLELYHLSPGNLQSLSIITEASAFADMPWTADVLADTSKPANGTLGQVGRFLQADFED